MLGLFPQEDHVGHPTGQMVELIDHPIDVLHAPALLALLGREADVADDISRSDGGKHDPIDARQLLGEIVVATVDELTPQSLRHAHPRKGDQPPGFPFGDVDGVQQRLRGSPRQRRRVTLAGGGL